MSVRVTADFAEFRKRLADIESRAADLRPVMQDLVEDLRLLIEEGFRTEGSSYGARWAPLAPAYRRQRQRTGQGTEIMQPRKSRRTIKSLLGQNSWAIEDVKRNRASVGTKLGIAVTHDQGRSGTFRGKRKDGTSYSRRWDLPRRKLLPPARMVADRYGQAIGDYVTDGTTRRRGL